MRLVDYTGKLNSHADYLEMLRLLETKSSFVEYVLVNECDAGLTGEMKNSVESVRLTKSWWGTKSGQKKKVFKIKAAKELFRLLRRYETFCKYEISGEGETAVGTDFGDNDIAFFDGHDLPLLYTTTHEGIIMVRSDLLS